MNLSRTERWILSNQFRILEVLIPGEAEYFQRARCVVDWGYEAEYDDVSAYIEKDVVTAAVSDEVVDILEMFRDLKRASERHGISSRYVEFHGFDGNNEGKHLGFAQYLHRANKAFGVVGADVNSHGLSLGVYRRQVAAWKESRSRHELTPEDVQRIVAAATHPDHR